MIEVLLLGRAHDPARVRQAVEEALQLGCSDVGAVRYLLGVREPRSGSPQLDQWSLGR